MHRSRSPGPIMVGHRLLPLAAVALLTIRAGPLTAQVVTVRTVPLPRWQQFDRLPSNTRAMGGIRVAVDDSLGDPFVNPAKGAHLAGARLITSPSVYHTNINPETGTSLPIGLTAKVGSWFGAAFGRGTDSLTESVDTATGRPREFAPPGGIPGGIASRSFEILIPGAVASRALRPRRSTRRFDPGLTRRPPGAGGVDPTPTGVRPPCLAPPAIAKARRRRARSRDPGSHG